MVNPIFHLVFGCILLVIAAYGYYIGKRRFVYTTPGVLWGKAGEAQRKKVRVYSVKEGALKCGYLFGNKISSGTVEVIGYSNLSVECFLMKSPKLVAFKGVSLEDTGNTYNVAQLKKDLEKNGASLVSDTLYLIDKDHTEQWSLVQ